jgi:hypothetical protein
VADEGAPSGGVGPVRRMRRLLAAVALGSAFALLQVGLFAVAVSPEGIRSTTLVQAFAFLDLGSMWAVVGLVGGGLMPRMRGSIVAGALTLLAAVWSYYGVLWLGTPGTRSSLWPVAVWSSAAVVGGPVLGAVGALGRRRDGWSLVAWIGGPLLVVAETGREVLVGDEGGYVPLHVAAWILTGIAAGIAARRFRVASRTEAA